MWRACWTVVLILGSPGGAPAAEPWSESFRAELTATLEADVARLTRAIDANSDPQAAGRLYSSRGDALFFLARFDAALADYEKLAELKPELDPFHWRRGLAYYYTGQYGKAASQFERYFEHDQSDRENGIWRFYAQVREHGLNSARKTMLPYEKPDRALLPEVYKMYAGTVTPEALEARIYSDQGSAEERAARLFYGHLYLGMDCVLKEDTAGARRHFRQALQNDWPQQAGYGPKYMWHVARIEYDRLPPETDPAR